MTRATAVRVAAVIAIAAVAGLIVARVMAPAPSPRPPSVAPTPVPVVGAELRWLVDLGPTAPVPDLAVHDPVVVGDRVLIAGARVGYAALDRATGAVAWRRGAGPELSPPLVVDGREVVLVHACDAAVAIPDRVVVGCFDRIDPVDIAARAAGAIHASEDDAGPCLDTMGPWTLSGSIDALRLDRPGCALTFTIPDGAARAASPRPPTAAPACERLASGTDWCQRVDGGVSTVEVGALRVPGLSLLAEAHAGRRTALVVRQDATLRHDVLIAAVDGAPVWSWPLPEPAEARATPVAVSLGSDTIYVVFDSARVAALAAP